MTQVESIGHNDCSFLNKSNSRDIRQIRKGLESSHESFMKNKIKKKENTIKNELKLIQLYLHALLLWESVFFLLKVSVADICAY